MTDDQKQNPDALLAHLESLYHFAQTVTLDAALAAHLVEATYRRALDTPIKARPPVDEKTWLFGLLMQIRNEQIAEPDLVAEEPLPSSSEMQVPNSLRRRLAEELLDRKLPTALAALPEDLRLLLMLCDVQQLPCADAGSILHLEAETACERLEAARSALWEALRASVTPVEYQLLEASLPADGLQRGLERFSRSELSPLPPTLLQSVAHTTAEQPPDMPRGRAAAATPRPHPRKAGAGRKVRRALFALLLILSAGFLGYFASNYSGPEPDANVITLSARKAGETEIMVQTGSAEQAELFVRDRLDWRLTVPAIENASLLGVGISEVAPDVEVPVFLFKDEADGALITLFTYSYALLDRNRGRIQLDPDVLSQIEDDQHFDLYDLDEEKVLIWRNRDDIFVAVTRGDAESLSERIYFPS